MFNLFDPLLNYLSLANEWLVIKIKILVQKYKLKYVRDEIVTFKNYLFFNIS